MLSTTEEIVLPLIGAVAGALIAHRVAGADSRNDISGITTLWNAVVVVAGVGVGLASAFAFMYATK